MQKLARISNSFANMTFILFSTAFIAWVGVAIKAMQMLGAILAILLGFRVLLRCGVLQVACVQ